MRTPLRLLSKRSCSYYNRKVSWKCHDFMVNKKCGICSNIQPNLSRSIRVETRVITEMLFYPWNCCQEMELCILFESSLSSFYIWEKNNIHTIFLCLETKHTLTLVRVVCLRPTKVVPETHTPNWCLRPTKVEPEAPKQNSPQCSRGRLSSEAVLAHKSLFDTTNMLKGYQATGRDWQSVTKRTWNKVGIES